MSESYTKLFASILQSTIWQESKETKLVWIAMLALADGNGEVMASIPGLAHSAGVTIKECEDAIATLMAPDIYSRTKDDEGRRIAEIDGGWELINHGKYREKMNDADRKKKAAMRQQRLRDRRKAEETKSNAKSNAIVTQGDVTVTPRDASSLQISHTEEEAVLKSAPKAEKHPPTPPEGGASTPLSGGVGEGEGIDLEKLADAEVDAAANFTADWGDHPKGADYVERCETVCQYAIAIAPTLPEPAEMWMVEEFVDFGEKYHWRSGPNDRKIRDWKAAFRDFIRNKPRTQNKAKKPA